MFKKMKTIIIGLLYGCISWVSFSQPAPKLVVGIVVDQMKQEYLSQFKHQFSEQGFKKLMNEGFQYKNAHYNYIPTYTAPGHASIYTGTTPSNHGIIANSWFSKVSGLQVYCVFDSAETGVGSSKKSGNISPRNLLASTITDEIILSSNFRSKVMGISLKDRGAVIPAGHRPTGAYWFNNANGHFITSTYYENNLPQWLIDFNKENYPKKYLQQTWTPLLPLSEYGKSLPDDSPYEKSLKGKDKPTFPYSLKSLFKKSGIELIKSTPYGNTLITDLALASIKGAALGKDEHTDFLGVSYSSTDYVGHIFGANSVELQDTYLRLDKEIARLLNYLEENFKDDYLIFLTSDHGVAPIPSLMKNKNMIGGYYNSDTIKELMSQRLTEQYGKGDWILNYSNNQLFLNHTLIQENNISPVTFHESVASYLQQIEGISEVFTSKNLAQRTGTAPLRKLLENGYHNGRSGDIMFRFNPGYINEIYGKKGTTHGSGYNYDTHVPILFYGKNIPQGKSVRKVTITDIAPTLSMLLDVPLPNACTGLPLLELFE